MAISHRLAARMAAGVDPAGTAPARWPYALVSVRAAYTALCWSEVPDTLRRAITDIAPTRLLLIPRNR